MERLAHLCVAAVSGFTILALEFAAVRQLAPAFGQAQHVWANVIGIILLALTLGYRMGGRLGERSSTARPLFLAYGLVCVWVVLAALLGPTLCRALIPTGLPTEGGLPLGFTGSLIAAVLLYGPPTFLLAMTSPFLIRLAARRGGEGAATGAIYAFGTVGSLVGCTVAPLWMLQVLGTRMTLFWCAGAAALLCVSGLIAAHFGHAGALPDAEVPDPTTRGGIARRWVVTALISGWAVTLLEFGAVRFMAPWFGQSNHVWANIIGLILLALALGSLLGGRWADAALARGAHGGRMLFGALGAAALAVCVAALVGPSLLDALLPAGVDSLRILPVAHQGSKASALLLFGVPMVLLGVAPPFLVRMAARPGHTGRAAGQVFAWTTVGGLLGCFTTSAVLVPWIGSRGVLLLGALALGGLGLAFAPPRANGKRVGPAWMLAGLAALTALGLLGHQMVERPPLRVHPGQIEEVESAYQAIRVVRENLWMGAPGPADQVVPALLPAAAQTSTIFLRHDEDAETYQSALIESEVKQRAWLTGGRYFEHMALGAFFAPEFSSTPGTPPVSAPDPKRVLDVLILGYAGGTVHRTLRQTYHGTLNVLGVEIDPAVLDVARKHLRHGELTKPRSAHPNDRLRVVTGEDARTVVNALPSSELFDLVLVDAYARTNYVPFQLATEEFFNKVKAHLRPNGWIGVNVLGHGFRGPVAKAVGHTMDHVYGRCWAAPNPAYPGNVIMWARPGAKQAPRLWSSEALGSLGPYHPGMQYAAFALERYLVRYNPATDGGIVLTDDRSPSDRLADRELGL